MSTEPEVTRIVRSWLEDGVDRAPERILDATLDLVPTTPQRRPAWPARRFLPMPSLARLALVAAAVVVVAVGATLLLPRQGSVGVPSPSPTPAPSASDAVTTSPDPDLGADDVGRSLDPGTYRFGAPFAAPFAVTVPFGWMIDDVRHSTITILRPLREDPAVWRAAVDVALDPAVYADPCGPGTPAPPAAPTVDATVAALSALTGLTASAPEPVTIGGHAGQTFELSHALDLTTAGCFVGGELRLLDAGGRAITTGQSSSLVWVLDVDGTVVVILGTPVPHPEQPLASSRAEVRETIAGIVGSMAFD